MLGKGSVIPHHGAWILLLMETVYTPSQISSSVNLVNGYGFKTRPTSKPRERDTQLSCSISIRRPVDILTFYMRISKETQFKSPFLPPLLSKHLG